MNYGIEWADLCQLLARSQGAGGGGLLLAAYPDPSGSLASGAHALTRHITAA